MIYVLTLLQAESSINIGELFGIGATGTTVLGLLAYIGKKLFDRHLAALDKNTAAVEAFGKDLSDHKTETLNGMNTMNDSIVRQGMQMDDGFAKIEDRLDRGAQKHEEFSKGQEETNKRLDKHSSSISDLRGQVARIQENQA